MAKNYMKEVANLFGLELEEEFKIKGLNNYLYKFTKDNILFECLDGDWHNCFYITFVKLLRGEYEIEKLILDQKEKEYLSNVIKPFRNEINYISKHNCFNAEWLKVYLETDTMVFPKFKENTMYKGMELDKEYSLKDLGI